MTATGGAIKKLTLGERFARAAAVFLDRRGLIVNRVDIHKDQRFSGHAPLTLDDDESPRREFPLG